MVKWISRQEKVAMFDVWQTTQPVDVSDPPKDADVSLENDPDLDVPPVPEEQIASGKTVFT